MATIFDVLLTDTAGDVHVWSLPNIRGEGRERWMGTRSEAKIASFVERRDVAGFGTFYAVSTIRPNCPRKKEFAEELKFLFADIDCKDIDLDPAEILRRLLSLPCPPSRIHATGNGFHVIWLLNRAVLRDGMEAAEVLLRRIARHLAGDPSVAHSVALLRVPGTHNSKRGEWRPVTVVKEGNERYDLAQIDAWLSSAREPVMVRKGKPRETNPFLQLYEDMGYKAPVNVKERLENMTVGGIGADAVHPTLLSVSGALTRAGMDEDDVVKLLLERVQQLDGTQNWNWKREERKIRGMIRSLRPKIEARKHRPNSLSAASSPIDDDATATLLDASDQIGHNSKDEIPLHLRISDVYLAWIPTVDKDLKWVPGLHNDRHFWKCENGIWSPLTTDSDVAKWMENDHRNILEGIGNRKKTTSKLFSEAAKCVMRSASVQEVGRIEWNAHGMIPTRSGLIDPVTFEIEPLKPEHHATWTLDVEHDPSARCPLWDQLLEDAFTDMSADDRETSIELLQEIFGVALIDKKAKALNVALALIGDSNTGKSEIISVLSGFFTNDPITVPMADLEKTHGTQAFTRRAPWTLHEAFKETGWHESDNVKRLVSGEHIGVNPKHGAPMTIQFTGPSFWAGNSMPKFKEATKAMVNRMIVIELTKTFDPETPVGVAATALERGYAKPYDMILETEKAGLLNWGLEGVRRALARGYFRNTDAGRQLLDEIRGDANAVMSFVEDCFDYNASVMISTIDFYCAFKGWWAENHGSDTKAPSTTTVGIKLAAASHLPIVQDKNAFKMNAIRYYIGLELNQAGKELWERSTDSQARGAPSADQTVQDIKPAWLDHPKVVKLISDEARRRAQSPSDTLSSRG